MDKVAEQEWILKLNELKQTMQKNEFEVYIAENKSAAKAIVLEKIIPTSQPNSISYGDSETFRSTGLYHHLKASSKYNFIEIRA